MCKALSTPAELAIHSMLAQRGALWLEFQGMRNSRMSVYRQVKTSYGFKGSKLSVLGQLEDLLENLLGDNLQRRYTRRTNNES